MKSLLERYQERLVEHTDAAVQQLKEARGQAVDAVQRSVAQFASHRGIDDLLITSADTSVVLKLGTETMRITPFLRETFTVAIDGTNDLPPLDEPLSGLRGVSTDRMWDMVLNWLEAAPR